MTNTRTFGKWGEQQAAAFLVDKGYHILARNVYTPYGEIDLIAAFDLQNNSEQKSVSTSQVVFCEVKTRRSRTFGYPEVSITPKKLEHMRLSVEFYINQHPELGNTWRIDVISIEKYRGNQELVITHFENIQV